MVLLGLGWWGDRTGFWADKSFVTNVFSSVTAATFGVPLALVVPNRVAMVQAEAVKVRAGRTIPPQSATTSTSTSQAMSARTTKTVSEPDCAHELRSRPVSPEWAPQQYASIRQHLEGSAPAAAAEK
ncbi:hypothetical protein [Streptomyces lydicus]|uniref:hypothetical protein n=1 Tax=Streptomyces lydicus TaxID=47763 RepID=UPI0037A105F9